MDWLLVVALAGACAVAVLGIVMVPNTGLLNFLTDLINTDLNNNLNFRLFVNNITPAHTDILTTYTEATFAGYARQQALGWIGPVVIGALGATSANNITFSNTSGVAQTIYGVYVTDNQQPATKLYFAERDLNAPIVIPNNGTYIYTPNFQDQSIN